MAADQRKKRLNTTSTASSQELGRGKKKKLKSLQRDLNGRSNISLEWDDKKKSVVAKREQISLTRRHLIPFTEYAPICHDVVVDVLAVPREVFELDNLNEVLSYEVWQTHLSENERNYLNQFLPKGFETHQVVQELLAGDNFHFGNPLIKWGASLCSGNLHPDAVLHQEQYLKTSKKSYYSELWRYHSRMICDLLTWKERWASCKDPENEIVHKIWRCKKQAEISISADAIESRYHDAEDDLAVTSESGSWAADEIAGNSDNQNLIRKHGELQKGKGFMDNKYDNLSAGLKVVARSRKGEKLHKQNIQCGDGSKYMSYIKITKEQHQRVKSSMKHSSNSIQSRSLNRVLGNLNTFHVQPFQVFEEEERKKLHEHWLQLATKDLPVGFANWRTWRIKKQQLTKSLEQEMEEKLNSCLQDEEENDSVPPDLTNNRASDSDAKITMEVEERGNSESSLQEQIDGAEKHKPAIALEDEEKENCDTVVQEVMDNEAGEHEPIVDDDNESFPISAQNRHLQSIPLLNGSRQFCPMDLDSNEHVIMETENILPNESKYVETLNHGDVAVSQGDPLSSTSDVWPAVSMSNSYYHSSSLNHDYASALDMSLGHSRVFGEQPARLIDLESGNHEDTMKDLLHRRFSDRSFFNPYPEQEVNRNELLQQLFKPREGFPYHHERKQTGLVFQPASNVSVETGQFSGPMAQQIHPSLPLEPRPKGLNDLYLHQDIRDKMFSDGGRYTLPRQELFSSVNVQDWAASTAHMSVPLQSHLDGCELGRNWFSSNQVRGGWSSLDSAVGLTQSMGNRSNTDQSLFGVLSQCNQLNPGGPYDSASSVERLIQSGSYGVGAPVPTSNNMLLQATHPLDFFSGGHETAAPGKSNSKGWTSMPRHNSALQDSMGKSFLRSWNKQG